VYRMETVLKCFVVLHLLLSVMTQVVDQFTRDRLARETIKNVAIYDNYDEVIIKVVCFN